MKVYINMRAREGRVAVARGWGWNNVTIAKTSNFHEFVNFHTKISKKNMFLWKFFIFSQIIDLLPSWYQKCQMEKLRFRGGGQDLCAGTGLGCLSLSPVVSHCLPLCHAVSRYPLLPWGVVRDLGSSGSAKISVREVASVVSLGLCCLPLPPRLAAPKPRQHIQISTSRPISLEE